MGYGDYPDLQGVKRVLVVKLRHLGDVLLTTPFFSVLKKRLPHAEIDAYVYKEAAPMLEEHPAIREILKYDRAWKKSGWMQRLSREAAILLEIRRRRYDLVLNLTEGDRGAMVARVSGAKIRAGVDPRKVYTHVAKSCPTPRHTVERQLDLLRRIGIFPESEERELFWKIPSAAEEAMRKKVPWERFILVHPAARWRFKCWPEEKMRQVAQHFLEKGEKLVFTAGPDSVEREMVERIVRGLDVCNLAGQLSLQELGALIQRATLLLCVDSVPFHMASALKRPVVALFGPTSEVNWGPWRNPHACLITQPMSCRPCYLDGCGGSKRSDCLAAIPVNRVISELELLAKVGAPRLRIVDQVLNASL